MEVVDWFVNKRSNKRRSLLKMVTANFEYDPSNFALHDPAEIIERVEPFYPLFMELELTNKVYEEIVTRFSKPRFTQHY